jgi:hypothetical protein
MKINRRSDNKNPCFGALMLNIRNFIPLKKTKSLQN